MKLSRFLNLPKPVYALALLSLPAVAIAPLLIGRELPSLPTSNPFEPPSVPSNFKVAWKPVCSQGNAFGMQASTSAEPGPHSVRFAGIEKIEPLWKAKLSEAPFPQIHGRAKLAKVPVMMYHDILPEKKVFFDVTPAELEAHFQAIQANGLTPINLDQLVEHLKTGIPLPEKPIVLTFDDGYQGHYQFVYPLLKKYKFPAAFGIYPDKVGTKKGRSSLTWEQLQEMAKDPLVTIASHSVTHPADLRKLTDEQLQREVVESKQVLEAKLGMSIPYFVYPEGKNDDRVQQAVKQAGYRAAWTMTDEENRFADESDNLLNIQRIGQSNLDKVMNQANGGPPLKFLGDALNFYSPVELNRKTVNKVPLILASGGKPTTIHANSRYQVSEIVAKTPAIAAVDGAFFSLESLSSNKMIGPALSRESGTFAPGNPGENPLLNGRPLVLINDKTIKFIPFDAKRHNTKAGMEAELPGVTDGFVGAAWLVRDGKPQDAQSFGKLYGSQDARDRAFWGIDWADRPVVGVSADYVTSVQLGEALSQAGLRDVVMLDSGASASLVYNKESMMTYTPRPVPHVVALYPPAPVDTTCPVAAQK
jgi:poly-beta-1,6-N-acetyl-D-glucosamine N-deacetylase